jgi:hypothetical protein
MRDEMKRSIGTAVLSLGLLASNALAEESKNYTVVIDGQEHAINPGEEVTVTTKAGAKMVIALRQNEFADFRKDSLTFRYPGKLSVAESAIDTDVSQYMMSTATGTLVIIQKYDSINPSSLSTLMLDQLTRESIAAGSSHDRSDHLRKLSDGTEIKGLKGTLKAPGDDYIIEVLAHDEGRGGYIFISQWDKSSSPEDQPMIDMFWSTLKIR